MSRSGTILGLSREQLRDIAVGVGRGFQAYDPNNPLAAAGAALEGSVMSGLSRERREEDRSFELEDEERRRREAKEDFTWKADEQERREEGAKQKSREDMIASGVFEVDPTSANQFDEGFANIFRDKVPSVGDDGRKKERRLPLVVPKTEAETEDRVRVPRWMTQEAAAEEWVPAVAQGLVSDEGNLEDVSAGIRDGDMVGLESFDLGFFGDGTPAIIVQGRGIPVDKSMWMSLAHMRRNARVELDQQFRFQRDVDKATESFNQIRNAAPMMQGPLGDSIGTLIQMDPKAGMAALQKALVAMERDGGKALHADVAADIQKRRNEASLGWLLRAKGKTAQPNPQGFGPPVMVDNPSVRDEQIARLKATSGRESDLAMIAWQRIEDMVPDPALRAMNPSGTVSFIETHLLLGRDVVSDLSAVSRLEHLASMSGDVWGIRISRKEPPTDPSDLDGMREYANYLKALNNWAAEAFGWDGAQADESLLAEVVKMRVQSAARSAAIQRDDPQANTSSQRTTPARRPRI